jgi:hypothetical protein
MAVSIPAIRRMDETELKRLASKYVWWRTPEEALRHPGRFFSLVMNTGAYSDVEQLAVHLGREGLSDIIAHAQGGEFSARSWAYWHFRLGLADADNLPAMPVRETTKARVFRPHSEILTPAQLDLWPDLSPFGVSASCSTAARRSPSGLAIGNPSISISSPTSLWTTTPSAARCHSQPG